MIRYPARYREERGAAIWQRLQDLIPDLVPKETPTCSHGIQAFPS
jgi:hypothetical protein